MANKNHTKKGSNITVEPIRRIEDIKAIKKLLAANSGDSLLFTMGINNGLRIGDLLKLKVLGLFTSSNVFQRDQETGSMWMNFPISQCWA